MGYVKYADLHYFCADVLSKAGVPETDANIIADSIEYAHKSGNATHGVVRLPIYIKKIKSGMMSPVTTSTVVRESPAVTVIDANHGFGQVAGIRSMDLSIDKANRYGIGLVSVRHSNNFGTAGYFAKHAVNNGFIGIVMANSAPAIAPTGGFKPVFGTNPIAFAFPADEGIPPIVFDMATSIAARGKIRLAARNGEKIPFGWALGTDGLPTDDPNEALKGTMLAIGEHKGYGLSLVIDILAGLLSGAGFGGGVKPLNITDDYSDNGHMFIALNINSFMEPEEYFSRIRILSANTKDSGNPDSVFLPGDPALYPSPEVRDSVNLKMELINELNSNATDLGCNELVYNTN